MVRFHVLSFEGPDAYSRAGGIATRVCGLSDNLARRGFRTHLWFVGDPQLPGREKRGGVELHRWCQWISQNDGGGVYEGEEGKRLDYATSLPPHLVENELLPAVRAGDRAVVLAEEWHTADAVLHLDWRLRNAGIRDRVAILWNANNTFGFHRLDWQRLAAAAVITTVSRYMKQLMRGYGVDAVVIHNGLGDDAFLDPDPDAVRALRRRFRDRIVLSKVGRWDPDKNWLLAVAIVGELKRYGWRSLLLARGGVESHGGEVMAAARGSGLHVVERELAERGAAGLLRGTANINGADIVSIRSPLDSDSRALLFQGSSAVLANSARAVRSSRTRSDGRRRRGLHRQLRRGLRRRRPECRRHARSEPAGVHPATEALLRRPGRRRFAAARGPRHVAALHMGRDHRAHIAAGASVRPSIDER